MIARIQFRILALEHNTLERARDLKATARTSGLFTSMRSLFFLPACESYLHPVKIENHKVHPSQKPDTLIEMMNGSGVHGEESVD
jgi:hypothetical protein